MVADPDVLARNLVGVVEGRAGDDRPSERNGLQLRDRRQNAGAPNLHRDRLDSRLRALGRIFVGARPARAVSGRAEDFVEPALVYLDDGAVDLEAEGVAEGLQLVDCSEHLVHRLAGLGPRRYGEAPLRKRRDHLAVRGEAVATDAARVVDDDIQRTFGGNARVELLQGTGAGVPRIRESLEPGGLLTSVELDEALARHVRLASHLKLARRVRRERLGDRRDCRRVRRYVVANEPVAARRRADETPAGVAERERDAVYLWLDEIREPLDRLPDERVEFGELAFRVGLVERLHRRVVRDLGEPLGKPSRDVPDRRIGGGEFREVRFELQELALPHVVVAVANSRLMQIVVVVVGLLDEGPQFRDPRLCVCFVHVFIRCGSQPV